MGLAVWMLGALAGGSRVAAANDLKVGEMGELFHKFAELNEQMALASADLPKTTYFVKAFEKVQSRKDGIGQNGSLPVRSRVLFVSRRSYPNKGREPGGIHFPYQTSLPVLSTYEVKTWVKYFKTMGQRGWQAFRRSFTYWSHAPDSDKMGPIVFAGLGAASGFSIGTLFFVPRAHTPEQAALSLATSTAVGGSIGYLGWQKCINAFWVTVAALVSPFDAFIQMMENNLEFELVHMQTPLKIEWILYCDGDDEDKMQALLYKHGYKPARSLGRRNRLS
jgi:hypothetical protein